MKIFMDWLANVFAPKAKKFTQMPAIAALSSAMQNLIPFILTGSVVFFYNVFRSYIPQLPDLTNISNYSFGMIGLVAAFMVGHQFMEKFRHPQYATTAGIVSICVLMMTLHPIGEKQGVYDLGRVGPTGILIGVLFGVAIGVIFHFYSKLNFLKIARCQISWLIGLTTSSPFLSVSLCLRPSSSPSRLTSSKLF